MYCDIDASARQLIAHRQKTGHLPTAPVHDDIRTLKPPSQGIDMVVGGFPCVGFSLRGKRKHFENAQSGLFYELVRIVRESHADAVFMENVPGVVAEMDTIAGVFNGMGFALRWTIIGADDVGAPHVRKRWFCLAFRPGSRVLSLVREDVSQSSYEPFDWSPSSAPERMLGGKHGTGDLRRADARLAMLGNGVVPDAVRLGFLRLLTAGRTRDLANVSDGFVHHTSEATRSGDIRIGRKRFEIPHICADGSRMCILCEPIHVPSTRHQPITLDPQSMPIPSVPSSNQTTPCLQNPVTYLHWSTPRHGMVRACRVLTERSSRDLPTQIVFETGTCHRSGMINADFCDWIMGLDPGYTACDGDMDHVITRAHSSQVPRCETVVHMPSGASSTSPLVFDDCRVYR